MESAGTHREDDLARRVYSYFVFRLRQPHDAERLTRLTFERHWREANLRRDLEKDPEMPVFAAARAVLAESPRQRGATRVQRSGRGELPSGLSEELAIAIGRLHGRERDAIALRFGAELSVGEIAQLLDRTPADVKQRLARGVRGLRDLGILPKGPDPKPSAEGPGA
jgi:DNA-directed RNA polymerase specialized sigma24 family protein